MRTRPLLVSFCSSVILHLCWGTFNSCAPEQLDWELPRFCLDLGPPLQEDGAAGECWMTR